MENEFVGLKVLLIEDEKEARTMMRDMLSSMGVTQIFEASDGKEGMQFLDMAFDLVDIVLCDWNMPNMTGLDLLRQFRSVDNQTPFLMITGRGDMSSVMDAKSCGVSAYILKPFSLNQLEAKLRILMFNQRKLAEVGS